MKRCTSCQKPNTDFESNCYYCGSVKFKKLTMKSCKECKKINEYEATRCYSCGSELETQGK